VGLEYPSFALWLTRVCVSCVWPAPDRRKSNEGFMAESTSMAVSYRSPTEGIPLDALHLTKTCAQQEAEGHLADILIKCPNHSQCFDPHIPGVASPCFVTATWQIMATFSSGITKICHIRICAGLVPTSLADLDHWMDTDMKYHQEHARPQSNNIRPSPMYARDCNKVPCASPDKSLLYSLNMRGATSSHHRRKMCETFSLLTGGFTKVPLSAGFPKQRKSLCERQNTELYHVNGKRREDRAHLKP
jgi:hypothetical protein